MSNDPLKPIANSMGITLYQRFTLNEASLFLRCPESDIQHLIQQQKIQCTLISNTCVTFFGFQLLEYILQQTPANTYLHSPSNSSSPDRIVRAKEVQTMTGLSRTTLWRHENQGTFPRRVSLGASSVGWRLSEVEQWLARRPTV